MINPKAGTTAKRTRSTKRARRLEKKALSIGLPSNLKTNAVALKPFHAEGLRQKAKRGLNLAALSASAVRSVGPPSLPNNHAWDPHREGRSLPQLGLQLNLSSE
jgi:hypothetical protein